MNELERLEARLSRLESRHRRVQLLCAASCTLLLGACLAAAIAPVSAEIRARRFVLVDEQGAERAVLETKERASVLTLSTPGAGASLALGAGDAGAGLQLEGGCGVVNIAAGDEGVWLGGDWNDEHDFDLRVSKERVGLSMRTRPFADEDEGGEAKSPPPEIELTAVGGAGAVKVRAGDEVTFHTP